MTRVDPRRLVLADESVDDPAMTRARPAGGSVHGAVPGRPDVGRSRATSG